MAERRGHARWFYTPRYQRKTVGLQPDCAFAARESPSYRRFSAYRSVCRRALPALAAMFVDAAGLESRSSAGLFQGGFNLVLQWRPIRFQLQYRFQLLRGFFRLPGRNIAHAQMIADRSEGGQLGLRTL
jgi:hypothetical protein